MSDDPAVSERAVRWASGHINAGWLATRARSVAAEREALAWDGKVNAKAWAPRLYSAAEADPCCLAAGFWRRAGRSALWTITGGMADFAGPGEKPRDGLIVMLSALTCRRSGTRPKAGGGWGLMLPLSCLCAIAERAPAEEVEISTPQLLGAMVGAVMTLPRGGAVQTFEPRFAGDQPLHCLAFPELGGVLAVQQMAGGFVSGEDFARVQRGESEGERGSFVALAHSYAPVDGLPDAEAEFARRSAEIRAECDAEDFGLSAAILAGALEGAERNPDLRWDHEHRLFEWGAPDAVPASGTLH